MEAQGAIRVESSRVRGLELTDDSEEGEEESRGEEERECKKLVEQRIELGARQELLSTILRDTHGRYNVISLGMVPPIPHVIEQEQQCNYNSTPDFTFNLPLL
jgi:hypothetical protein